MSRRRLGTPRLETPDDVRRAIQRLYREIDIMAQSLAPIVSEPGAFTDNGIVTSSGTGGEIQGTKHTLTDGGGQTRLTLKVIGTQIVEFSRILLQQYEGGNSVHLTATGTATTGALQITPDGNALFDFLDKAAEAQLHIRATNGAADPSIRFEVEGLEDFVLGIDDSDGDRLKLSASAALGTADVFDADGARLRIRDIFSLGPSTSATIATGAITPTSSYVKLAPESGTADDLDTVNGGASGDILVLSRLNSGDTITVKDATGNLILATGGDFILNGAGDKIMLIAEGANWHELSRSDN